MKSFLLLLFSLLIYIGSMAGTATFEPYKVADGELSYFSTRSNSAPTASESSLSSTRARDQLFSRNDWLKAILLIMGLLLIWQANQLYLTRKLKKKRAEIDKLLVAERERTRIARHLNDDLGSELFGLKLMGQVALSRKKKTETVSDLEKMVELSKELSDRISEIIWVTDVNQDTLLCFWSYLQKYISLLLRPMGVPFYFESLSERDDTPLSCEKRLQLIHFYKCFLPELLNHQSADDLVLFFKTDGKYLQLYINPIPKAQLPHELLQQLTILNGNLLRNKNNQLLLTFPLT